MDQVAYWNCENQRIEMYPHTDQEDEMNIARYNFLVEFTKQHPLSNGQRGWKEMERLKYEMTGLTGKELTQAVANDIHNQSRGMR